MPVSEDEYRTPRFIKYMDRYPISYDKNERYTATLTNARVYVGRANSNDGSGWKQPGYNPNHNSTTIERVNLTNVDPSFRPY